jgi:hypothetical protein
MHMHTARKIARKTSEKPLNLKSEMCFATETSLAWISTEANHPYAGEVMDSGWDSIDSRILSRTLPVMVR